MPETPDADLTLPSGAESHSCFREDVGGSEGCFGDCNGEGVGSDCSGCSADILSAPRLALEAAAAVAAAAAAAAWETEHSLPPAPPPIGIRARRR